MSNRQKVPYTKCPLDEMFVFDYQYIPVGLTEILNSKFHHLVWSFFV